MVHKWIENSREFNKLETPENIPIRKKTAFHFTLIIRKTTHMH